MEHAVFIFLLVILSVPHMFASPGMLWPITATPQEAASSSQHRDTDVGGQWSTSLKQYHRTGRQSSDLPLKSPHRDLDTSAETVQVEKAVIVDPIIGINFRLNKEPGVLGGHFENGVDDIIVSYVETSADASDYKDDTSPPVSEESLLTLFLSNLPTLCLESYFPLNTASLEPNIDLVNEAQNVEDDALQINFRSGRSASAKNSITEECRTNAHDFSRRQKSESNPYWFSVLNTITVNSTLSVTEKATMLVDCLNGIKQVASTHNSDKKKSKRKQNVGTQSIDDIAAKVIKHANKLFS